MRPSPRRWWRCWGYERERHDQRPARERGDPGAARRRRGRRRRPRRPGRGTGGARRHRRRRRRLPGAARVRPRRDPTARRRRPGGGPRRAHAHSGARGRQADHPGARGARPLGFRLPRRRRGGDAHRRRGPAQRCAPGRRRAPRHHATLPALAHRGHHAVQLSRTARRSQDRAGDGVRSGHHAEAPAAGSPHDAAPRRDHRRLRVPAGGVNVVPCHVEVAQLLIEDPRVRMISFTGSAKAGWAIRAKAGTKRVALELGGNAAVLVEPDADLAWAASRCAFGGFTYAGQSCISTQRIFVHERVMQPFLDLFLPAVRALHVGDVLDDATEVGPLISFEAAERVERWIAEAVQGGAEVATGGTRRGPFIQPAVLLRTTPAMKVNCEEVFAPLVTVTPYRTLDEAIAWANDSPYGLQAGVFSTNVHTLLRCHAELDVGAVNGNDVPGYRVDR